MNHFPDELSKILDILKSNPRGMSVTDISQEIGVNRNTVARYLDNLLVSGQVDMKTYGKAKVFFLSQRVPISAMLNFSSDMVIVLDREMRIIQINNPVCAFAAADRDDIIGKELRDSPLVAFDHPLIQEKIGDAMKGEEINEELRFLRVDRELFFRFKIIPTAFNDGTPGVTLILEDITEQKLSEEALRRSESTYRRLVEEINDVIWNVDQDFVFTYVSPRVTDVLGFLPEEMTGRAFPEFVNSSEAERIREFFSAEACDSGASSLTECTMRHRDGKPVTLEASGNQVIDEFGEPAGYRLVCRDITDRKKAMERVRQWKLFLLSIVQNIPAAVTVKEVEGDSYVFFNRSAENLLQISREEATAKRAEDLFSPDMASSLVTGDDEVKLTQKPLESRNIAIPLPVQGQRFYHMRKIPIFNPEGVHTYILGIFSDITDRKRAEEQILEQRDRAEQYLDGAGVMIAVIGSNGRITRMNKKGCAILGYEEADIVGKDWFDLIAPPRMQEPLRRNFTSLMAGACEPPEYERGIAVTKWGEELSILWHNVILKDAEERNYAMVSSGELISAAADPRR